MNVDAFLEKFTSWSMAQSDIEAGALTGSYARGVATEDSDVDLMILGTDRRRYVENKEWLSIFGEIEHSRRPKGSDK
jgi:predicted nucleotidyltransferase